MKAKLVAIGTLCLLLLFISCGGSAPVGDEQTATPRGRTPPPTSLPMPPPTTTAEGANSAQTFTLLDNQRVRLSDYLGRVVVLDFWATFCPPCLEEAPHLNALQERFGERGLQVIGLNVGGPEDRSRIPGYAEQLKIQYLLGLPEPELVNLYLGDDNRLPQTLVFDRKGRVVKHFVGYDSTVSQELDRAVEQTMNSNE